MPETTPETMQEMHARLLPEVLMLIVKPIREAGGQPSHSMALLESTIVGVIAALVIPSGDDRVLVELMRNVRIRLTDLRTKPAAAP